MRRQLILLATVASVAACGGGGGSSSKTASVSGTNAPSSSAPTTTGTTTTSATSAAGSTAAGPSFVAVPLMDDAANDGGIPHKDNSIVTGIVFDSPTHGVVSLAEGDQTVHEGGAIEELTAPDKVSSIAFAGFGKGPKAQNISLYGLQVVKGAGIVALSSFGEDFLASVDQGHTWGEAPIGTPDGPNIAQVWLAPDSAGIWHLMDDVGNVWSAPAIPSATTTWTRTWQPEGSNPDPAELPPGACPSSFHQTYYAMDQQAGFFVSSDGQTMMYGNGLKDFPAGVCRSTDGGKSFYPVAFPNPPEAGKLSIPYVLRFFDDQHGFAARANEDAAGTAWVYTTSDGGATWTAGTLPAAVSAKTNITSGFTAPDGKTAYLVGFGNSRPLLLRSDDAGSTWTDDSGPLVAAAATGYASDLKLHTGFALDADHIWVGGEGGGLFYSATGGK